MLKKKLAYDLSRTSLRLLWKAINLLSLLLVVQRLRIISCLMPSPQTLSQFTEMKLKIMFYESNYYVFIMITKKEKLYDSMLIVCIKMNLKIMFYELPCYIVCIKVYLKIMFYESLCYQRWIWRSRSCLRSPPAVQSWKFNFFIIIIMVDTHFQANCVQNWF